MENAYIIKLKEYTDKRGTLIPFEYNNNCPFEIQRFFIIYNVPKNTKRGEHINIDSKNIIIAINGSCKIKCIENKKEYNFILNSPDIGLFINNNIYREIYYFSNDCILLCISDKKYNKEEYINIIK